jgi:poly(A) polymerase Pap1
MAKEYLGVSAPFSIKLPTEADIALTEALENTLKKYGMYENKQRTAER